MTTLVLILALLVLAVLVWKLWKPRPKREVPVGEARLYFFYTDWCGWSQKAMPEWEQLERTIADRYGRTHVTPVRVNAEEDRKTATLYEIQGFPTVILETHDAQYMFKKRPTHAGLQQFLTETLGPPPHGL